MGIDFTHHCSTPRSHLLNTPEFAEQRLLLFVQLLAISSLGVNSYLKGGPCSILGGLLDAFSIPISIEVIGRPIRVMDFDAHVLKLGYSARRVG